MDTIAGVIRALAQTKPPKPLSAEEREALKQLVEWAKKNPDWERMVKDVAEQKLASSVPKAVALAILTLLPALGSASEVIQTVKPVVQTQTETRPTAADLKELRDAIPKPDFNFLEVIALRTGAVSFEDFRTALATKVEKGMPGVMKVVKANPRLAAMSQDQLARAIGEQFSVKIGEAEFSKERAMLDGYLKKMGKRLDDVKRVVSNHLAMHKDLFI